MTAEEGVTRAVEAFARMHSLVYRQYPTQRGWAAFAMRDGVTLPSVEGLMGP